MISVIKDEACQYGAKRKDIVIEKYIEADDNTKRLVAAAPQMLEALEKANDQLAKFYIHSDRPSTEAEQYTAKVWDMVKQAIQKATE